MKLRERVKVIRISPFVQRCHVIISSDVKASYAKRVPTLGSQKIGVNTKAFVWSSPQVTHTYMFLSDKASLTEVVHESVHVIAHAFEQNGIKFDDEIWAYHLDELFDVIAGFLHGKKRGNN